MPILTLPAKLLVMGKVSLEDGERESAVWGRSFNREEAPPVPDTKTYAPF